MNSAVVLYNALYKALFGIKVHFCCIKLSRMSNEITKLAIEIATKAVEADNRCDYENALKFYRQ